MADFLSPGETIELIGQWYCDSGNMRPTDDILPHTLGLECQCHPRAMPAHDGSVAMVIHQRFDGKDLIKKLGIQ